MTWGYVAVGAATVIAGSQNADATEDAANAASNAATSAGQAQIAEARRQFNLARGDTRVARETSNDAMRELGYLLGLRRVPNEQDIAGIEEQLAKERAALESARSLSSGSTAEGAYTQGGEAASRPVGIRAVDTQQAQARVAELEAKLKKSKNLMKRYGGGIGEFIKRQPGYEFGLEEGNRAIENRMAAGGTPLGGRAIKAGMRFGIDYAGAKTDEHLSRLFTLAGFGPAAANTSAGAGANLANTVANAGAMTAGARGNAAYMNAASNIANTNNLINTGMTLYGYNQMNRPPAPSPAPSSSLMTLPQGSIPPNIGAMA